MSEDTKERGSRARNLTVAQKAEAVALWRSGTVTLEDLSKKFKKRPEAFSRLFKRMGIERGEAAAEAVKKIAEKVEAKTLSSVEETLKKINEAKSEYQLMSHGLAKLAWNELVRARQAKLDIASLKDVMATLKLAGEVIGNSRKEIFTILNVEKHEEKGELDELPELTVRELTPDEVNTMRSRNEEDDMGAGFDESDLGGEMMEDASELGGE